jgi:hypothetical protein
MPRWRDPNLITLMDQLCVIISSMSRGPGQIEKRIGALFAKTRDRALSVDELCDVAFHLDGETASRSQRLSTTRAAHRVLTRQSGYDWRATLTNDRRLWFHPDDYPLRVWAVSVQWAGVIWADAEITKITERNVMVRYGGATARLDRGALTVSWVNWRGVMFASSRTGLIAAMLDMLWQERFGGWAGSAGTGPPVMRLPLADAVALLKLPPTTPKRRLSLHFGARRRRCIPMRARPLSNSAS